MNKLRTILSNRQWIPLACVFAVAASGAAAVTLPNGSTSKEVAPNLINHPQIHQDQRLVDAAAGVIRTMKQEPYMTGLLKSAAGAFIVPNYGRDGYGGKGMGLLVVNRDNRWTDPGFYDFRSISLGPTVHASSGSVVLLLRDRRALDSFETANHTFSLKPGSGLSVISYSRHAKITDRKHDLVMWTDVFRDSVGVPLTISDVSWDWPRNETYYGEHTAVAKILGGSAINDRANELNGALLG